MDRKALKLCARFALQPNLLGYCGRKSATAIFYDCIVNNRYDKVREELEKFIVLNPYLQTIAEIIGQDPYDFAVIEAYWLGNDLLSQIKPRNYTLLIQNLAKQGVPEFLISEIKDKIPKEFIPIHLFNILHVGVGKASGSVPFNLDSINNCMVRWGRVKEIEKKDMALGISKDDIRTKYNQQTVKNQITNLKFKLVTVETVKLVQKNKHYQLENSLETIPYLSELVGDLKAGDIITAHWGWIAMRITQRSQLKLQKWTKGLIASISIN